ncbi:MAG: hypothetical protein RR294_03120 [Bacilli bacterium]
MELKKKLLYEDYMIPNYILNPYKKETYFSATNGKLSTAQLIKILKEKSEYLKEIQKKFNYSKKTIDMLSLIYLAFMDEYDLFIEDLFYDVINEVEIYTGPKTVAEISKDNNKPFTNTTNLGLYVWSKPSNKEQYNTKYIIVGEKKNETFRTNNQILCTMIHEIRHALTNRLNTNILNNKGLVYIRSGLSEFIYKDGQKMLQSGTILDEVFNVVFTEQLMDRIINYKFLNLDNKFLRKIEIDNIKGHYYSEAYWFERLITYPLQSNEEIMSIVKEASMKGNLEPYKEIFNGTYSNYEQILNFLSKNYRALTENEFVETFDKGIDIFKDKTIEIVKKQGEKLWN